MTTNKNKETTSYQQQEQRYDRAIRHLDVWKKCSRHFEDLLLAHTMFPDGDFIVPTVDDIVRVAKSNMNLKWFHLVEINGKIFLVKPDNSLSSEVIACHTSSGSVTGNGGYRYVNFMTRSGSVYWGSGDNMDSSTRDLIYNLHIFVR